MRPRRVTSRFGPRDEFPSSRELSRSCLHTRRMARVPVEFLFQPWPASSNLFNRDTPIAWWRIGTRHSIYVWRQVDVKSASSIVFGRQGGNLPEPCFLGR